MTGGKQGHEAQVEEVVVLYLRPDGWWEAGRGFDDEEHAGRCAEEQMPNARWRVIRTTRPPVEGEPFQFEDPS
jgi:hypothetical protein